MRYAIRAFPWANGEGFTLHKGEMTFNDRCGVCKDKAGMLITMLRAAGMKSYPAMTMAGSRIDYIPADQFNHCVTVVKLKDGTIPPPRSDLGAVYTRTLVQRGTAATIPDGCSRRCRSWNHTHLRSGKPLYKNYGKFIPEQGRNAYRNH